MMEDPPALDEPPPLDEDLSATATAAARAAADREAKAEAERRIEREASKAAADAAKLAASSSAALSSSTSRKENEENFMDEILRVGTAARRAKEEKKRAERRKEARRAFSGVSGGFLDKAGEKKRLQEAKDEDKAREARNEANANRAEEKRKKDAAFQELLDLEPADALVALRLALPLKERGNEHFRSGRYGDASDCYGDALAEIESIAVGGEAWTETMIALLGNRAAAALKLHERGAKEKKSMSKKEAQTLLKRAVSDCSDALSLQPENEKALRRRATARERLGTKASLLGSAKDWRSLANVNASNEALRKRHELRAARAEKKAESLSGASSSSSGDIIEVKARKGVGEGGASDVLGGGGGGLRIPEAQRAAEAFRGGGGAAGGGAGSGGTPPWMTPDFLQKLAGNPRLAMGMSNPRCMEAMQELMKDPAAAQKKYGGDEMVSSFLREFTGLLGNHFTGLAEQEEARKEEQKKKAERERRKMQRDALESARKKAVESGDSAMASVLGNRELVALLQDEKMQAILRECGDPRKLAEHMRNPETAAKIKKMADAGLVQLQL